MADKKRFNPASGTLLKKNLGRFAPFWVLYTLGMLLMIFSRSRWGLDFQFAISVARDTREMALWNLLYGALMAQLVFGDLYDARMCSGLHALPLRREEIFGVNVLSGLVMNLIPTGVAALVLAPLLGHSGMENGAMIALWWFAALNLEFFFFFGLAVFSSFCVGNRLAMAVVCIILNFGAMIAWFLVVAMIQPMFLGVRIPETPFTRLCPVGQISGTRLLYCENKEYVDPRGVFYSRGTFRLDEGWSYLLICAALGVVLLGLALWLYRKRKLECAGDFSAFPGLKPVFLVLISLCAGAGFQMVYSFFLGLSNGVTQYLFGAIGLTVGWFVGSMLMERTARVFTLGRWGGLGLVWVGVALCLGLVRMDPMGIEGRIPDLSHVASAELNSYTARTPEELEKITRLHRLALDQHLDGDRDNTLWQDYDLNSFRLRYQLKDGKTLERYYYIDGDSEAGRILAWFQSQPITLFGDGYEELSWLKNIQSVIWRDVQTGVPLEITDLTGEQKTALMEAVTLDAAEGTLSWGGGLHKGNVSDFPELHAWTLDLLTAGGNHQTLTIFADSRHCMQWLKDTGLEARLLEAYWEVN